MVEDNSESYYLYNPSHALPIVFAALIGISWLMHIWQNFRYHFWRVTYFMAWGGTVFMSGWIMRAVSSYNLANMATYSAQYVLILCGPPIYSAAEYNTLGRLMHYLPMHAPLNPSRLVYFFVYLGAAVESLTAAGAAKQSVAKDDIQKLRSGQNLVLVGLILQAVVEVLFMTMVGMMHYRCAHSNMMTRKVRNVNIMLYGTSTLILLRCICRAVEGFAVKQALDTTACEGTCNTVLRHEWFLYAFEAAPMVLYTYWLNFMHPGRLLPREPNCYLDFEKIERRGPGWIDKRATWMTFVDLFDVAGTGHEKFWLKPDDWPVVRDMGSEQENFRK